MDFIKFIIKKIRQWFSTYLELPKDDKMAVPFAIAIALLFTAGISYFSILIIYFIIFCFLKIFTNFHVHIPLIYNVCGPVKQFFVEFNILFNEYFLYFFIVYFIISFSLAFILLLKEAHEKY
jgi:hypothetical protein